jgi:predicted polyphosphate/ATP-dependent NAD kinase
MKFWNWWKSDPVALSQPTPTNDVLNGSLPAEVKLEQLKTLFAEVKLERLKALLFPPLKLREKIFDDGEVVRFHVDSSVDSNLNVAITDVEDGYNDAISQKTLNVILKRLLIARTLLGADELELKGVKTIKFDMNESEIQN